MLPTHATPAAEQVVASPAPVEASAIRLGIAQLSRAPYLLSPSGALTALTIDLISSPAVAAAAAAIAEESRRCLRLMAASRDGGVPIPTPVT
jgi:hypothetical protein